MKKLIRNDAEEKKCVTGYSQEDVGYAKMVQRHEKVNQE